MATEEHAFDRSLVPGIERPRAAGEAPPSGRRDAVVRIALVGFSILFIMPLLWLVSSSLKVRSEVFSSEWIPDPLQWSNYAAVWREAPVLQWFGNSLLVGVLATASVTISSAFVAFGFAYFRFRWRKAVFGLVLATMMLPAAVTMVPTFIIWDRLGWTNTHVPLWAHNLFGSAFYIFMLRQFFLGIPRDLFDAARVDGANYFQVWWRIAMPLTKPALIVVAIFEFKASWFDLMRPLIYLTDEARYTMPLGLKALMDQFGQAGTQAWELLMAGTVLITAPMILLFFVGQRYFVEGIATTGTKG
ncbi:MAG TPA: carbohydrate ABC transporter permease [Actinomycetota bacterium]|nr:carbohydrate ABC transporter permease [Actinomycetota bacterium]